MLFSPLTTFRYSSRLMVPFASPSARANIVSTVTCPVKAFVDATPISGPTCMYVPVSVARGIDEPMALQMP